MLSVLLIRLNLLNRKWNIFPVKILLFGSYLRFLNLLRQLLKESSYMVLIWLNMRINYFSISLRQIPNIGAIIWLIFHYMTSRLPMFPRRCFGRFKICIKSIVILTCNDFSLFIFQWVLNINLFSHLVFKMINCIFIIQIHWICKKAALFS